MMWISWVPSLEVGMVPGQSWDSGWWLAGGWGWLTCLVTEYFPPKYLLSAINNRFPPSSSGSSPALRPTHKHLFALCFVVTRSEGRLGDYQRRGGRFPSPTLDARIVWSVEEGRQSGQRCRDLVTEFRWKMDIGQSGDTEDQRNTWGQRRQWAVLWCSHHNHLQLNC